LSITGDILIERHAGREDAVGLSSPIVKRTGKISSLVLMNALGSGDIIAVNIPEA